MTVYVIADIKVTDDRWVPAYAASVHESGAQTRWQVSVTQREREDTGGQTSGYHPYRTSGVSIDESSRGLRHRSQLRSLCRGPSGRQ